MKSLQQSNLNVGDIVKIRNVLDLSKFYIGIVVFVDNNLNFHVLENSNIITYNVYHYKAGYIEKCNIE